MIPGDGLPSTRIVPAAFLEPRDRPYDPLLCAEYGGPLLQTPAQSRLERVWLVFYEGGVVYVAPEDGLSAITALFSSATVETLSLAFDANMNPTVAYMDAGVCKLRWFDSSVNSIVTSTFPGVTSCQCTTDDKRAARIGQDDVIFMYTRDGGLYYRQQRDRYTVEYQWASNVIGKVVRLGMNTKNRLQVELQEV